MSKTNKDKAEIKRLKERIKSTDDKVKIAITHISFASGISTVDKGIEVLRNISKEMDEWARS